MKKTVFSKFLAVILSLLMSAGVLQTGVPVFAGEEPGGEMITLTFKKDGAAGPDVKITVPSGKPIDLAFPENGLKKVEEEFGEDVEYDLIGWTTKKGSAADDVYPKSSFDKDTTIWPRWKSFPGMPESPVYFAPNGGTGGPNHIVCVGKMNNKFPTEVPVREGYRFKGWAKSKNATEPDVDKNTYISKYSVFYAVWEKENPNIPVTSVEIIPGNINLKIGETVNVQARIMPEDATNKDLTWSISPEGIVERDSEGNIKAKAPGEARIKAKSPDGPEAECVVKVEKIDLNSGEISEIAAQVYTGNEIKPNVTLKMPASDEPLKIHEDYEVEYENNVDAGEAIIKCIGKGNYKGTLIKTFNILPMNIDSCEVDYKNKSLENGENFRPGAKIVLDGKLLINNKDYIIEYPKKSESPGRYVFTVKGKGNYKGSVVREYFVVEKKIIKNTDIQKISNKVYTGKKLVPNVSVKKSGTRLVEGKDYKLSVSNNVLPGFARIKVEGIGEYKGIAYSGFYVVPAKAYLGKLKVRMLKGRRNKRKKATRLQVNWKRQNFVSGYHIQIFKSFKGKKRNLYVKKSKQGKMLIHKMASGKYYVRIRSYIKIGSVVINGEFSAVKKIKIKKKK